MLKLLTYWLRNDCGKYMKGLLFVNLGLTASRPAGKPSRIIGFVSSYLLVLQLLEQRAPEVIERYHNSGGAILKPYRIRRRRHLCQNQRRLGR